MDFKKKNDDGILEKLVHINRITKVVKGGRRFGFSALVVVGDQAGKIGIAHAKAKQVPDAIKKANELAFETPYRIACLCAEVVSLCVDLSINGNPNSISDVGVAVESAYAGFKGASMNVLINMPSIENKKLPEGPNVPFDEPTGALPLSSFNQQLVL